MPKIKKFAANNGLSFEIRDTGLNATFRNLKADWGRWCRGVHNPDLALLWIDSAFLDLLIGEYALHKR